MSYFQGAFLLFLVGVSFDLRAGTLIPVSDGKSDYKIVVPDQASACIQYAARDLQSFLKQSTGAALPIVTESRAGGGKAFLLGPTKRSLKVVGSAELGRLRPDGIVIRTSGTDIILRGNNDRGEIYSVDVFLEKYLGVRFLAIDCTVVPKQATLKLEPIDYSYAPPFFYREYLSGDILYAKPTQASDVCVRQRLNGSTLLTAEAGGRVEFYPFCHSFYTWVPPATYFPTHPEYYSLLNGKRSFDNDWAGAQLCLSNPEVARVATEGILAYLKDHPGLPIIDVSQMDCNVTSKICECPKCQAIIAEEGAESGLVVRFINTVADEIAKQYPDKSIMTLAYQDTVNPPKITRPRKNVLMRVCRTGCIVRDVLSCTPAPQSVTFKQAVDEWKLRTENIFVWHYGVNYRHFLAPVSNFSTLCSDIRYYAGHGVKGVMILGDHASPGGELTIFRQYYCSQLLWDPDRDPAAIEKEFCEGYYGAAGQDVLAYIRLLDSQAKQHVCGPTECGDPQKLITPEFLATAVNILSRARSKVSDPVLINRVELAQYSLWYMQLSFPDRYKFNAAEAGAMIKKIKRLVRDNNIWQVKEHWRDQTMPVWIQSMEYRYLPEYRKKVAIPRVAVPFCRSKPAMDGSLSDEGWGKSCQFNFRTAEGDNAIPAARGFLTWDNQYLYMGFRLDEPEMGKTLRKIKERDGKVWEDDSVEIFLTPENSKSCYHFIANMEGVLWDTGPGGSSWNGSAEVKTRIDKNYWILQLRIPLVDLDIKGSLSGRTFTANFFRNRFTGRGTYSCWSVPLSEDYYVPERFGVMKFYKN